MRRRTIGAAAARPVDRALPRRPAAARHGTGSGVTLTLTMIDDTVGG